MAVEVHEVPEVAAGRWEAAAAVDLGRVAVGAALSAGGGGEGSPMVGFSLFSEHELMISICSGNFGRVSFTYFARINTTLVCHDFVRTMPELGKSKT